MVQIDSQKLIRCHVSSAGGVPSARFIEFEVFKLWQYMMTTKHNLDITDISLCLWVMKLNLSRKKNCI